MVNFNSLMENIQPNPFFVTLNFEGEEIEVKQYLPANEKLSLIGRIVELAHEEDTQFANPVKVNFFTCLEIVYAYTNIEFDPDEQEQAPGEIYDKLYKSGLLCEIIAAIPQSEYQEIVKGVDDTINAYYSYQNSVMGILDTLKQDYSTMELDAETLKNKIADPETADMIKEILSKLG